MLRRRGFTIVELMVVLGIVTVLMALLAPALSSARNEANQAKCQSNLRQILTACASYAYDNDASMPWANWLGPETAGYRPQGWLYHYPHGTQPLASPTDAETGSLFPRLNTIAVYHCPQDSGPYEGGPTQSLTSYLINGAVCGYGRHLPSYRITAFAPNDIMFWEPDPFSQAWTDGAIYPSHEIATRHSDGGSIGCFDGHVEWISVGNFATEEMKLPGRLWCSPETKTGT
jgi:prepilin-type N-terminal cleavage/methylation domain-containing protein